MGLCRHSFHSKNIGSNSHAPTGTALNWPTLIFHPMFRVLLYSALISLSFCRPTAAQPLAAQPMTASVGPPGNPQSPSRANRLNYGPTSPDDTLLAGKNAWSMHFQQTVITQWHPRFPAAYTSSEDLYSLQPVEKAKTSLTTTLFLGRRLWKGAEVYLNPELSGGAGLSKTQGVAGFLNGETYRVGDPTPNLYLARLYVRQIIALPAHAGERRDTVDEGPNQVKNYRPARYLAFSAGKFSVEDFFDSNPYSHDPRSQFYNWALMSFGAWDYPANTRGYTIGGVAEYVTPAVAIRLASVIVPVAANGPMLHAYDRDNHSEALEVEHRFQPGGRSLTVKLLGYLTHAHMGNYQQALSTRPLDSNGNPMGPDITLSREEGRTKYGFGLSLVRAVSPELGWFGRLSWNDGRNETWAFTEIDQSASVGLQWTPTRLHRPADALGVALVANGISGPHRAYLKAGGYGFIIGDGTLRYGAESIFEVYYRLAVPGHLHCALSPDYQFVVNPAYNQDRGPVHVFGLRVHVEI